MSMMPETVELSEEAYRDIIVVIIYTFFLLYINIRPFPETIGDIIFY